MQSPKAAPKTASKPAQSEKTSSAEAKPAAGKKAAKATKENSAAKKKPETSAKKKPLVGQKPRTEKSATAVDGSAPPQPPKASSPVNNSVVKASPASTEAKQDFKVNDHVVYPAHGVGRIVGIEKQLIAGITNELFLIDFEQEKMKLRVPTAKAKAVGMRPLSDPALIKKAIETLKGRARVKRTMWSRRAQEYEAKINSGDIISVAEVVRDLYRASDQPEQSYSERQLFEAALDRLAREVAAVNKYGLDAALADLDASLQQKKAA
ncbi:MAG: CarD family transcriptional regulator [Amphiplicatus sp.]